MSSKAVLGALGLMLLLVELSMHDLPTLLHFLVIPMHPDRFPTQLPLPSLPGDCTATITWSLIIVVCLLSLSRHQ